MASKTEYEINDSELLMFVQENHEEAKDYLYEKFSPLIHKEINRVRKRAYALGVDFSDLSQEAMLAFSHAINGYNDEEESKFMTFAVLCIRRRLANYISKFDTAKSKSLASSLAIDATVDESLNTVADLIEEPVSTDPLKKVITNETLGEVKERIESKLSDNEKLALEYDLDGKSIEEIATLMEMSQKQIYNLIYRARYKIKL